MTTAIDAGHLIAAPSSPKKVFRADVQGLRAVAVLLVIGYHSVGLPREGFIGVDVFFVISGFVITTGLLAEAEARGSVSLMAFYGRRVRRIAPAALVTLLVVVVAASFLPAGRRAVVDLDVLWSVVGLANLRMMAGPALHAHAADVISPVGHFWSLAVEEQFYLVWPLVFLVAWRIGRDRLIARRWVLGAAFVAVAVSLSLGAWSSSADASDAYFSTAARAWELGVGVLLAVGVPSLERITPRARTVLAFGGMVALEVACVASSREAAFPVPGALLPVLGTSALIAAGTGGLPLVTRALGARGLRWVGTLSYSLYLWHFPVFVFVVAFDPVGGWSAAPFALVVTGALAWLSYRFIERPALRAAPWPRRARPFRSAMRRP